MKKLYIVEYFIHRMQMDSEVIEAETREEAKTIFKKHFPKLHPSCVEKLNKTNCFSLIEELQVYR
ncbi:hypothetical protein A616_17250 [Brevibacillus brevis X23]|nr:hypothetical protein A616_17250 [Brevibacillus brevis X23]